MGVKPTFSLPNFQKSLQKQVETLEKVIVRRLQYLGEQCVNVARSNNTYLDQTGNLRNSIGYVILKNGSIVHSNFTKSASVSTTTKSGKSKTTKGSGDGVKTGQDLAKSLSAKYPRGHALIVVAGMNYAAAVEAKGKDVLTTAEQFAEKELPRMVQDLKINISKMQ